MKPLPCRVGVFDSGIGGLSVLTALQKRMPDVEYVYCCDHAYFPYGTKSETVILDRVLKLLPTLVQKYDLQILVIACNTASTIALESLRKVLPIPIVGVVPAIKPAAQLTKSGVIGLLATEATVRNPYTDKLIRDFASNCKVIRLGSPKLVELAERKIFNQAFLVSEIAQEISPILNEPELDTVILACTHFDHLAEELKASSQHPITWVSSVEAIASRTSTLVEQTQGVVKPTGHRLVSTKPDAISQSIFQLWQIQFGFKFFETLSLN